jgi:hypothetical protein
VQEFPDIGEIDLVAGRSTAEPSERPARRMPHWAVLASLALHVVLVAALSVSLADPYIPAPIKSVAVEILTSAQFDALVRPRPATSGSGDPGSLPVASPSGEPSPPDTAPLSSSAVIHPTEMLSQRDLARPQSRQAVAAMKTMSDEDRIDQLCAIEASAQIHAWRDDYQPDRLISFAMSGTRMDGDMLVADGAAFRSRRNWYHLAFRCGLTPDHTQIAAFEFQVGRPVPREEWEERNLAAVH